MKFARLCLTCLVLSLIPLAGHAGKAHVHGKGHLAVAIDGNTLTLMLEAPGESLVGFEHAARNARERTAIARARQTLERPAGLFVPSAAAACTARSSKLASPLFDAGASTQPDKSHQHAHGKGHEKGHEHVHADIKGEFVFHCARPEALRDLDVRLFASFPRLKQLQFELAGPRGQTALRLTPQQTRARW